MSDPMDIEPLSGAPTALGALYQSPDVLRESCVYPPADRVRLW